MLDLRKLRVVARFELAEALGSRLLVIVLFVYGVGAAIGSLVFLKAMAAAEDAARRALANGSNLNQAEVPQDLVRSHALPLVTSLVDDAAIRAELLRMSPLSIFYGYTALLLVALLVLVTSAGKMASDLASGASRFTLFRCERLTWAVGKLLGQEILLAVGLCFGALLAGLVGIWQSGSFEVSGWWWLLRTSFRAWIYGSAYLGIFSGLSLVARSTLGARAMSLAALIGLGVGHAVFASEFARARAPVLSHLRLAFPAEHREGLWSPEWASYLPSLGALLLIGALGFTAGYRAFRGRDA
jgi:hypothetical protein